MKLVVGFTWFLLAALVTTNASASGGSSTETAYTFFGLKLAEQPGGGLKITYVLGGSPSATARLEVGDTIDVAEEVPAEKESDLVYWANESADQSVQLTVTKGPSARNDVPGSQVVIRLRKTTVPILPVANPNYSQLLKVLVAPQANSLLVVQADDPTVGLQKDDTIYYVPGQVEPATSVAQLESQLRSVQANGNDTKLFINRPPMGLVIQPVKLVPFGDKSEALGIYITKDPAVVGVRVVDSSASPNSPVSTGDIIVGIGPGYVIVPTKSADFDAVLGTADQLAIRYRPANASPLSPPVDGVLLRVSGGAPPSTTATLQNLGIKCEKTPDGFRVTEFLTGSRAENLLELDDVIVKVEGTDINTLSPARLEVLTQPANCSLKFKPKGSLREFPVDVP